MKLMTMRLPIAKKHLTKLERIARKAYHPLQHRIHTKHNIAKRTLFYMKEYGSRSNPSRTIIRESIKVLLIASLLSSLGGFSLEYMKTSFLAFMPLIILLPVLNGLIGNYGIVISSKFTTLLYTDRIGGSWLKSREVQKLFRQVSIVALVTGMISVLLALGIARFTGVAFGEAVSFKILAIVLIDVLVLVTLLLFVAVYGGFYFFKRREDPNNFLIPLTTSIADFGNMIVLAVLVGVFF